MNGSDRNVSLMLVNEIFKTIHDPDFLNANQNHKLRRDVLWVDQKNRIHFSPAGIHLW